MTKASAAQPTSAVHDQIERVAGNSKRLPPFSAEQLEALGDVALWRILVEPYIPPYKGQVAVDVGQVMEAQRVLSTVGRILQVGEFAYLSKTAAGLELSQAKVRAQVGEYWLFEMYAGQEVNVVSGHKLRILNETDLLVRIKDPDQIKNYL